MKKQFNPDRPPTLEVKPLDLLADIYEKNLGNIVIINIFLDTKDTINFGRVNAGEKELISESNKKRAGFLFEFLKTLLSPFLFKDDYIIVRTCQKDDLQTKIDEMLIDKKRGEVVSYFNSKVEIVSRSPNLPYGIKDFIAHPYLGQNNRIGFGKRNNININEKNFSFITFPQDMVYNIYNTLKRKRLELKRLVDTILNFMISISFQNEELIKNYLREIKRENVEEIIRNALSSQNLSKLT